MGRRRVIHEVIVRLAAVGLVGAALTGCGSGSVEGTFEVASGTLDGRAWVARAGLAGASGICLEVTVAGVGAPNRLCGLREGESGQWQFDVADGTFMAGTIDDEAATTARLILADGAQVSASVVGAADVTSLRFFVLVVPRGAALDQLDLLDADGAVLESLPVGDRLPVKDRPPAGGFRPLRAGQARLAGSG